MRLKWQGSEWRKEATGEPVWLLLTDFDHDRVYAHNFLRSWCLPTERFLTEFVLVQAEIEHPEHEEEEA